MAELYHAAKEGDLEKVKQHLEEGQDIHYMGTLGTPLHAASFYGHVAVVELLLANKAKVNGQDSSNRTPLHMASYYGHVDVVELLLVNKAEINAQDEDGDTPLHNASSNGYEQMVEVLLANNAGINIQNTSGETPLHKASYSGKENVVQILLANKADVNCKDSDGQTPLHYASRSGEENVVQVLLSNKADVNCKDNDGNTPLMRTAYFNRAGTLKVLLDAGADRNLQNNNHKTAAMIAEEKGYDDILLFFNDEENEDIDLTEEVPSKEVTVQALQLDDNKCTLETGGIYIIEDKDVTVCIPDDIDEEYREEEGESATPATQLAIAFNKPPEELRKQLCVEPITIEPHGKVFSDHMLIKVPMDTDKKMINPQLVYDSLDGTDLSGWLVLENAKNAYGQDTYFTIEDQYCCIFTRHTSSLAVIDDSKNNIPRAFRVKVGVYASYSQTKDNITLTTAFSCACNPNMHQMLESKETTDKYGNLLLGPFNVHIKREGVDMVDIDIRTSDEHGQWRVKANDENIQPELLEDLCVDDGLETLQSVLKPTSNVDLSTMIKTSVIVRQSLSSGKDLKVTREKFAELHEYTSGDGKKYLEIKKCLCNRCNDIESIKKYKPPIKPFTNRYLKHEYDILYQTLDGNKEKLYILQHDYLNLEVEKNNLLPASIALTHWRNNWSSKKEFRWGMFWGHLDELNWKDAKEMFEIVFEKDKLLTYSKRFQKDELFPSLKQALESEGIITKDDKSYTRDVNVKNTEKMDYVIKHILVRARIDENHEEALRLMRKFNQILTKDNNLLLYQVICWLFKSDV